MSYNSTDGEIRCMYTDVNKTKAVWIYMEDLSLHTGTPQYIGNTTQVLFLMLKLI